MGTLAISDWYSWQRKPGHQMLRRMKKTNNRNTHTKIIVNYFVFGRICYGSSGFFYNVQASRVRRVVCATSSWLIGSINYDSDFIGRILNLIQSWCDRFELRAGAESISINVVVIINTHVFVHNNSPIISWPIQSNSRYQNVNKQIQSFCIGCNDPRSLSMIFVSQFSFIV